MRIQPSCKAGVVPVFVIAVFCCNSILQAGAGDLDPDFGGTGFVLTDMGAQLSVSTAVAIQPDGKIVAAGFNFNPPNTEMVVLRYNSDGTLDSTFSDDGKLTIDFGLSSSSAGAVAIQSDGKIVVAGTVFNGNDNDFAVVRLTTEGIVDLEFTQNLAGQDYAQSIAIDSDGKILIAGYTQPSSDEDHIALARYNSDGTRDLTFSDDGLFVSKAQGRVYALAIQKDGKIIAAGSHGYHALVQRFTADGTLDRSFSHDGSVITRLRGCATYISGLSVQENGKIVAVGSRYQFTHEHEFIFLARYDPDGSLDQEFGEGGIYPTTHLWAYTERANGIALQKDGKIIVAAQILQGTSLGIARFTGKGQLDPKFSGDGRDSPSPAIEQRADAVAIQPDGKIVLVGSGSKDFLISRYLSEGSPCTGTKVFCADFEDGVLDPGWSQHQSHWFEANGFLTTHPQKSKAEIIADGAFAGCQICSVETGMITNNDATTLLGWYVDKQNTIELTINTKSQTIIFKQRINGEVVTQLKFKTINRIYGNTPYQLKIKYDGLLFSLYFLDMNVPFATIPFLSVPFGTVGFRVDPPSGAFSYVLVN